MEWLKNKLKTWNKGHCTWFWDNWFEVRISNCCEDHDSDCSTRKFFNCLVEKFNGKFHATYIGLGASVGCWGKHLKYMLNKTDNSKLNKKS